MATFLAPDNIQKDIPCDGPATTPSDKGIIPSDKNVTPSDPNATTPSDKNVTVLYKEDKDIYLNKNNNINIITKSDTENNNPLPQTQDKTYENLSNKANANFLRTHSKSGSPGRARTADLMINRDESKFVLANLLATNDFDIPKYMIKDWITTRNKKKAAVTQTAWNKINKELAKCKEKGINPVDAFETMVARGWQALDAEWVTKEKKDASSSQCDVDSVMEA